MYMILYMSKLLYSNWYKSNFLRNVCITTNNASGGDGIPVELFQILKDDAVESAALNMPANLENSAVATGLEKVSFHSNPK